MNATETPVWPTPKEYARTVMSFDHEPDRARAIEHMFRQAQIDTISRLVSEAHALAGMIGDPD